MFGTSFRIPLHKVGQISSVHTDASKVLVFELSIFAGKALLIINPEETHFVEEHAPIPDALHQIRLFVVVIVFITQFV
jgi:hypothetical protein